MKYKFVVGQKVVCINDKPWKDGNGEVTVGPDPVFNEIYTIEDIVDGYLVRFFIDSTADIFLKLKEFKCNYDARYFKPLEEKKTDISDLKKLLIPSSTQPKVKHKVKENVLMTWSMMILGFVGLAFAFRQRRRSVKLAI
jgi:hypothetical protein